MAQQEKQNYFRTKVNHPNKGFSGQIEVQETRSGPTPNKAFNFCFLNYGSPQAVFNATTSPKYSKIGKYHSPSSGTTNEHQFGKFVGKLKICRKDGEFVVSFEVVRKI